MTSESDRTRLRHLEARGIVSRSTGPLSVACHYCGARPGESCRQTMLDRYTPTEPHKVRQAWAAEGQGTEY